MKKIILLLCIAVLGYESQAQAIDPSQILMYLDFEGDLVDDAGNFVFSKNTGGLNGDVTYSSVGGQFGDYGVFADASYISANNTVYNNSNSASISVWVRLDASANVSANSNVNTILDMANNGGGANDGQSQLRFRASRVSTTITAALNESTTTVAKTVWYHIVSVIDANDTGVDTSIDPTETVANRSNGSQKLYINGVLEFYDRMINPRNVSNRLILASQKFGNGQDIKGDLDDLMITSEVLSSEQVKAVMNLGVEASRTAATTCVWNGGSADWDTASNWSNNTVPTITNDVFIPAGTPNDPVASGAISFNNIIISENASLEANGSVTANEINAYHKSSFIARSTVTGNLTYTVITQIQNDLAPVVSGSQNPAIWSLLSAPVVGETYDNIYIRDNFIGTGTAANRAIALYDNSGASSSWSYYQSTSGTSPLFESGIGFSTRKKTTNYQAEEELYPFTGTYADSDVAVSIAQGSNTNWNLVGNPYPSYLAVSTLIADNTTELTPSFQTAYVWDTVNSTYTGLSGSDFIAPGQGFFVNAANSNPNNFNFSELIQNHRPASVFYRNNEPEVVLSLTNGSDQSNSRLFYGSNYSLSLDSGSDIGMFTGTGTRFNIHSRLVSNDQGIPFERQALPDSDFENTIVPVGINVADNEEIIFTADTSNLPTGFNVYLEDRDANTITQIDQGSEFRITFASGENRTERFFIHTSTTGLLSSDDQILDSIRITATTEKSLRITGIKGGSTVAVIYNMLGKNVKQLKFSATGNDLIEVQGLSSGLYVVKLITGNGVVNKKVILN
ncbi:MAG: T9SS type A sorting domain-containing protein [Nonlabens sp.]